MRRIGFKIASFFTVLLCLITILFTTPWGSNITVIALNKFDVLTLEYKDGAILRDLELHLFELTLDGLKMKATDVALELNAGCVWSKSLCITSLKINDFLLNLSSPLNDKESEVDTTINTDVMFVMPFDIKAERLTFNHAEIIVNDVNIIVNDFIAKVNIAESYFGITKPTASLLMVNINSYEDNEINDTTEKNWPLAQLPSINLPIELDIKQLDILETKIIINQEPYKINSLALSARWEKEQINIAQLKMNDENYGSAAVTGHIKLHHPYPLNLAIKTHIEKMAMWPEIINSSQKIQLSGDFEQLKIALNSEGSLVLNSDIQLKLTDANLPFIIDLTANDLSLPHQYVEQYSAQLANSTLATSSINLSAKGDLQHQLLSLDSHLSAYGYTDAQLNLELELAFKENKRSFTVNSFLFKDVTSKSDLQLTGKIVYQSGLSWQIALNSSGFTLPHIDYDLKVNQDLNQYLVDEVNNDMTGRFSGKLETSGQWSNDSWAVALTNTTLVGNINDIPLSLKGHISLDHHGQLTPGKIEFTAKDSQLIIEGDNNKQWQLNGKLLIPQVGDWLKNTNGKVDTRFFVSGEISNPIINIKSDLSSFFYQQISSPLINLKAAYQPLNNQTTALNILSDKLTINNNTFEKIDINLVADMQEQQLLMAWQGDVDGDIKINSHWFADKQLWQANINKALFNYQETSWQPDQEITLVTDFINNTLLIDPHCWQGPGLNLCLPDKVILGNEGDVTLKLALDLAMADQLLLAEEIELTASITGDIHAFWSKAKPIQAQATFIISEGNLTILDDEIQQQVSQWQKSHLNFLINENITTLDLQLLKAPNEPLIKIQSSLDLNNFNLDGKIQLFDINLQPLEAFIPQFSKIEGKLNTSLIISGTNEQPLVNGDISLNQGRLSLLKSPNDFEQINLHAKITNNHSLVDGQFSLSNQLALLSGYIDWQSEFIAELNLTAEQLPLNLPPELLVKIKPNINVHLNNKSLKISGQVEILEGQFTLEELPEGSVEISDDVIIVDYEGKQVSKKESAFNIETDIRIIIAKAFNVTSQGLQSNLQGELQMSQKPQQPLQLFGQIKTIDGTYHAYGQKLKIEKGEISFNGPVTDPYINIRAIRQIKAEDVTVGIEVTGLADALSLKLFSTPSMENPEMLSYLIRGRGLDAGTGDNSNSNIAASLLVGYGITNSSDILSHLDKLPFISNIVIDTEGDGDSTQATISGYIGERIFLKYGIGVYEPINELTVRMYILNRLWLETVSGIEKSSDIYYSFDIE